MTSRRILSINTPSQRVGVAAGRDASESNRDDSADHAIITAFRSGISVAEIARQIERPQGAVTWALKKAGLKANDRRRPRAAERGDVAPDDAARHCRAQDMAFQETMQRAIAAGEESPPSIGVFVDRRPLYPRRLSIPPVPHSSGCGSPASECADLYRDQN